MNQANDWGIFVLRITLGVTMLAHGLSKYFVSTLPGTVGFFESLGLPGFTAYLVFAGETGGGLLLILGVKVRIIAALLIPILVGATVTHFPNGWLFSTEGGGWEYPAFMTLVSFALVLMGNGALALDDKIFGKDH